MSTFVLTETGRKMIADKATGHIDAHGLELAKVFLFNNPANPQPLTGLGDLTEATFPGYVASPVITWDTPLVGPGSQVSVQGDDKEFVCNATPAAAETIYGAYLAHNAAGNGAIPDTLLGIELFDTPVGVGRAGQGVRYTPHFEYP